MPTILNLFLNLKGERSIGLLKHQLPWKRSNASRHLWHKRALAHLWLSRTHFATASIYRALPGMLRAKLPQCWFNFYLWIQWQWKTTTTTTTTRPFGKCTLGNSNSLEKVYTVHVVHGNQILLRSRSKSETFHPIKVFHIYFDNKILWSRSSRSSKSSTFTQVLNCKRPARPLCRHGAQRWPSSRMQGNSEHFWWEIDQTWWSYRSRILKLEW